MNVLRSLLVLLLFTSAASAATIPTPSEYLRFPVGADRQLADYHQIVRYFRALDEASPRLVVESLGATTLGNDMIMAVISSEENIANLRRIREISARLADPRGLDGEAIEALVDEGRAVVLVTCNIHSTEIASSQMAMEWAHALVTGDDPVTRKRLDDVVLLLVPSLNPDGQIMETEWYRKWVGTSFEGGRMPWLYHPYVGHDNNRDWFMMTQKETRNMSRAIYHEWFPQLFVDEHQMGSRGPRMFIPPFSDPLDPDVHPLIWREVNLIGSNMAFRLEQAGKPGLIYGYSFDAYWLGGTRNTGWWKNITGLLLEVASARMATPVYIDPSELGGGRKGLTEYTHQVNHPHPWKGGWWRMRDIMDYERIASDALLEIASERREDFLRNIAERAGAAVQRGANGEAWVIPAEQRDRPTAQRLARLLADHNVEVFVAPDGAFWVPLAQPYSRFAEEMLEVQRYPEVRMTGADEILPPYDVATWTLPAMMGVVAERAKMPAGGEMRRLAPSPDMRSRYRQYDDETVAEPAVTAEWVAIAPLSGERAKVVNRALSSGGKVWIVAEGGEPVPGTIVLDRRAAEAAARTAREAGVDLHPLAEMPPGALPLRSPRVATYKPWLASMDEGWTRWLLEQYGFEPGTVDNEAVRGGKLVASWDVIILPDVAKAVIDDGKPKRDEGAMQYFAELPPPYRGGVGEQGRKALLSFVEAGGTLIAFNSSTDWVISHFNIPVHNLVAKAKRSEVNVPGSLLRVDVRTDHPATWGLPEELAVFADDPAVFETELPAAERERWVLASYAADTRDLLVSGWIRGEEKLARRAAAVAVTHGKGRIVLFGFRPQNRAQTHATFPFVFNAITWSVLPSGFPATTVTAAP